MTDLADALAARLDQRRARVVVIGQGYVGLPVAMRASAVGFPVVGFDTDAERVAALRAGTSYVNDVRRRRAGRARSSRATARPTTRPIWRRSTSP